MTNYGKLLDWIVIYGEARTLSQASFIFINWLQVGISLTNRAAMLFLFALHNFWQHTPINFDRYWIWSRKKKHEMKSSVRFFMNKLSESRGSNKKHLEWTNFSCRLARASSFRREDFNLIYDTIYWIFFEQLYSKLHWCLQSGIEVTACLAWVYGEKNIRFSRVAFDATFDAQCIAMQRNN